MCVSHGAVHVIDATPLFVQAEQLAHMYILVAGIRYV